MLNQKLSNKHANHFLSYQESKQASMLSLPPILPPRELKKLKPLLPSLPVGLCKN